MAWGENYWLEHEKLSYVQSKVKNNELSNCVKRMGFNEESQSWVGLHGSWGQNEGSCVEMCRLHVEKLPKQVGLGWMGIRSKIVAYSSMSSS